MGASDLSERAKTAFRLMKSGLVLVISVIAAGTALTTVACADNYPSRTTRIYVGFPAGSGPDGSLRVFAQKLSGRLGKPVIVENVTGANGNTACQRVANSPPDGYSLVLCTNSSLTIASHIYTSIGFDPIKDLKPIAMVSSADNILVVPPSLGIHSVADLVALAKKRPGQLMFAHGGFASTQYIAAALFESMANISLKPIAYRGSSEAIPDLLAGRIQVYFSNIANALPMVQQHQLIGLATVDNKRSASSPDIPTMQELGYKNFYAVPWYGLMAPAGTPDQIAGRLNKEAEQILSDPDTKAQFAKFGFSVFYEDPGKFAQTIQQETKTWGDFLKAQGIKKINE